MNRRRDVLATLAGIGSLSVAGCTGGGNESTLTRGENEVLAGPNNELAFEPETLTVSPGTTVTWRFASPNHNVSGVPDDHRKVSIPDGAEPFSSYDGNNTAATVAVGETYTHTFETAGTYTYVCIPHARSGMVGTIEVQS